MVEPDLLVRAAGSFLLAPVGVAAILLARGNRGALALGSLLVVQGLYWGGQNLFNGNETAGIYWTPAATLLVLAGLLARIALFMSWPMPMRATETKWAWLALAIGAAVAAAFAASIIALPGGWEEMRARATVPESHIGWTYARIPLEVMREGLNAAVLVFLPLRFLASAPEDTDLRTRSAWGAILLIFTPFSLGAWLAGGGSLAVAFTTDASETSLLFVGIPLWLLATRKPQGHFAARVAIGLAAFAFLGYAFHAIFHEPRVGNMIVGVERSTYAFLFAYGIARLGLLGHEIKLRTARRGTVAMAALASLFVVAQIAQEFLSAQYGLLMGGIVAGALLFVANPVQRAMERVVGGRDAATPPGAEATRDDATAREDAYRDALRFALRDDTLTREEELRLHGIAEHMGITGRRAHALLMEIETERRAR